MNKKFKWAVVLVVVALVLDQVLKIWVKTHMLIGESSYVNWNWNLKWAQLLFVENRGMAFGMELPGNSGKFILTSLRLVVISFIGVYIYKNSKKDLPLSFILVLSMIFAGAAGNLIDSLFYGMIFEKSPEIYSLTHALPPTFNNFGGYAGALFAPVEPANFVKMGTGYDTFMHGKVVDMFYFPIFSVDLPNFIPIWGGTTFNFFEPVFNVADSFITVGVIILLIFGKRWFGKLQEIEEAEKLEKETEIVEQNFEDKNNDSK